jgi:WD40 repeat protein
MGYLLRASIRIGRKAVRAVLAFTLDGAEYIAVGSLAGFVRIFLSDSSFSQKAELTLRGPVTSLALHPPTPTLPDGGLLIGSRDRTAQLWDLRSVVTGGAAAPVHVFSAFAKEVCFVGASPDGSLMFVAAWDSTAGVFSDGSEVATLFHNEFAVWGVCSGPNSLFTAGGDSSIRKFSLSGDLLIDKVNAHSRAVRAVAWAEDRLVSLGNDGVLIEWDADLNEIARTVVSSDGLYTLSVLDGGTRRYAAGGSGQAVFVIEGGRLVDAFPIGSEVWSVGQLSGGDIIAGSDDGFLYVLTQSQERRAPEALEAEFLSRLAGRVIPLPDLEDADVPEFGDAEPRIGSDPTLFRRGESLVLAVFVPGYDRWIAVGSGRAPDRVQDARGRRWDVIADIVLPEGETKQLCFNRGENEYLVTRRFIVEQELPMHHLEVIAAFLRASAADALQGPYTSLRPEFPEPPVLDDDRATVEAEVKAAILKGEIGPCARKLQAIIRLEEARDVIPVKEILPVIELAVAEKQLSVLADHFIAFGDAAVDALVAGDVIGRIGDIPESEQSEFARFVLNFACFANRKPGALDYIARKIEEVFGKLTRIEEKAVVLKAADVVATYSSAALDKVKLFVARLKPGPDAERLDSRAITHILSLNPIT